MESEDLTGDIAAGRKLLSDMETLIRDLGFSVNDSVKAGQISVGGHEAIGEEIGRVRSALEEIGSLLDKKEWDPITNPELSERTKNLYTDGTLAWNRIGELIGVITKQTMAHSALEANTFSYLGSNDLLTWPTLNDADKRINKLGISEWGTDHDALMAFRLAESTLGRADKLLFHQRYIQESKQTEIARVLMVSQSALSARLSRLADRLSILVGIEKVKEQMISEGHDGSQSIASASGPGIKDVGTAVLNYSGRRNHVDLRLYIERPLRLRLLILPSNRGETVKSSTIQTWNSDIKEHILQNAWRQSEIRLVERAVVGIYRRRRASIVYYPAETFLTKAMPSLSEKPSEFFEEVPSAKTFKELVEHIEEVTEAEISNARQLAGMGAGQVTDTWLDRNSFQPRN